MNISKIISCIILVLMLCVAGCGGPARPAMAPVKGKVLLDNAPIEGAAVMFVPSGGGRPALGSTNAAGEFELMTFATGDGALLGEHKVSITKKEISGVVSEDGLSGSVAPGGIQEKWIVPERYSQAETSGLTAKVERGMQPIEFKLTK